MENENDCILTIPPEIHIDIKKYLSNVELKRYNLTCNLINCYKPSKTDLQFRKCGNYNITYDDILSKIYNDNISKKRGELTDYSRLWKCGHKACIEHSLNIIKEYRRVTKGVYIHLCILYAKYDDVDYLDYIITRHNILKVHSYPIFENAIKHGALNVFKYLLNKFQKDDSYLNSFTDFDILSKVCENRYTNVLIYLTDAIRNEAKRACDYNIIARLLTECDMDFDIIRYLIEDVNQGRLFSISDKRMREILKRFIKKEKLEIIKYMVDVASVSLNLNLTKDYILCKEYVCYNKHISLLERAIETNNVNIVEYFLTRFDIKREDLACLENGKFFYLHAISYNKDGRHKMIEYLLDLFNVEKRFPYSFSFNKLQDEIIKYHSNKRLFHWKSLSSYF